MAQGNATTGASIEIDIEGKDAAVNALRAAARRLEHPQPLWDLVGALLVKSTQQRFEDGKGPDGNPWPASFRTKTEGGKVLLDSGHLRKMITHEASDTQVAVGTNVIYAAIHQFGGVIRAKMAKALHFVLGGKDIFVESVTMPARPFLGLEAADLRQIEEEAGNYVLAPFAGADHAG